MSNRSPLVIPFGELAAAIPTGSESCPREGLTAAQHQALLRIRTEWSAFLAQLATMAMNPAETWEQEVVQARDALEKRASALLEELEGGGNDWAEVCLQGVVAGCNTASALLGPYPSIALGDSEPLLAVIDRPRAGPVTAPLPFPVPALEWMCLVALAGSCDATLRARSPTPERQPLAVEHAFAALRNAVAEVQRVQDELGAVRRWVSPPDETTMLLLREAYTKVFLPTYTRTFGSLASQSPGAAWSELLVPRFGFDRKGNGKPRWVSDPGREVALVRAYDALESADHLLMAAEHKSGSELESMNAYIAGKLTAAVQAATEAASGSPPDARALFLLAVAEGRWKGREARVRSALERAVANGGGDPVVLHRLATTVSALGEPEAAAKLWLQAATASPGAVTEWLRERDSVLLAALDVTARRWKATLPDTFRLLAAEALTSSGRVEEARDLVSAVQARAPNLAAEGLGIAQSVDADSPRPKGKTLFATALMGAGIGLCCCGPSVHSVLNLTHSLDGIAGNSGLACTLLAFMYIGLPVLMAAAAVSRAKGKSTEG